MEKDELLRELARVGAEFQDVDARHTALRQQLKPLIVEAGRRQIPQVDIVKLSGYTRERVRQLCLPPEQAEQEADARRKRRRR